MGRMGDLREGGAGHAAGEGAAIGGGHDLVPSAPDELGGCLDAMKTRQQLGIMQKGRPAIARQTLAGAHPAGEFIIRNLLYIRFENRGIHIGPRPQFCVGQAEEIGDVAGEAVADLDPKGIHQGDRRQTCTGLDGHFSGDPAAEGGADQRHVGQLHLVQEVEIEIGEIISLIEAAIHGARAKTGRGGDDDAGMLREAPDEGAFVHEPQICGEIEDIASLAMDGDGQLAPIQIQLDRFLTHQAPLFSWSALLLAKDSSTAA